MSFVSFSLVVIFIIRLISLPLFVYFNEKQKNGTMTNVAVKRQQIPWPSKWRWTMQMFLMDRNACFVIPITLWTADFNDLSYHPLLQRHFRHKTYCYDQKAQAASAQCFTLWQQATIDITQRDHLLLLVRATYIYGCSSSRTSRSWWIAHSTQRQRRGCNNTFKTNSVSFTFELTLVAEYAKATTIVSIT